MSTTAFSIGPRWSHDELYLFFRLVKEFGPRFQDIADSLPLRTEAMVSSLYEMHRGYLSLSEASAEGFCTILKDYYTAQQSPHPRASEDGTSDNSNGQNQQSNDATTAPITVSSVSREPLLRGKSKLLKSRNPSPSRRYTDLEALLSPKYDLPWFYWFDSFLDMGFLSVNEFQSCLHSMGIAKLTKAPRPVWASIRASMGKPRRLSKSFLELERGKLERDRMKQVFIEDASNGSKKRKTSRSKLLPEQQPVIVQFMPNDPAYASVTPTFHPVRFHVGTVLDPNVRHDQCLVQLSDPSVVVTRPLSTVMPYNPRKRRLRKQEMITDEVAVPAPSYPDVLHQYLTAKDLLARKWSLLQHLSRLNAQHQAVHPRPSAPVEQVLQFACAHVESTDDRAWLLANLDATNRALRSVLQQLRHAHAENERDESQMTLNLHEMRWASTFLARSQRQALAMARRMQSDREAGLGDNITELIANCVCLMSVIQVCASQSIPQNVEAKLVGRVLELLAPVHGDNVGLYEEVRGAVAGFL